MASNMVRVFFLLGLGCLGLLIADTPSVFSQQVDFFRQSRRESIQNAQRSNLQELLDKMGEIMDADQKAQFDRETTFKDAHYVSPSGLSAEEELERNQAARNLIQILVNNYCNSYSGTDEEVIDSCDAAGVYFTDLPPSYQAIFYASFPEYDPASSQYNRDLAQLLGER